MMRDSGIGRGGMPRGRRLRSRLGLERNELRRRVDRVQRWAALGIFVLMVLVSTPVAAWCATMAYEAGLRAERHERADRRQVVATVVAIGGIDAEGNRYLHETVRATWQRPGTPDRPAESHSGTLPSWKGARVGAKKTIWVDLRGEPTGRPRPHGRTVTDAAYAAGSALPATGLPFLVAYVMVRRRCDRHRYAMWDAAWARMDAQRGRNSS